MYSSYKCNIYTHAWKQINAQRDRESLKRASPLNSTPTKKLVSVQTPSYLSTEVQVVVQRFQVRLSHNHGTVRHHPVIRLAPAFLCHLAPPLVALALSCQTFLSGVKHLDGGGGPGWPGAGVTLLTPWLRHVLPWRTLQMFTLENTRWCNAN